MDTFVKLTKVVNASEKADSKNGGNQNENRKNKSNSKSNGKANQGSSNQKKNSCKIHEGKHDWSKCPNNTFLKSFKGNNGGKPINIEGAETKKKTSFKEKSKDKAHFIRE